MPNLIITIYPFGDGELVAIRRAEWETFIEGVKELQDFQEVEYAQSEEPPKCH